MGGSSEPPPTEYFTYTQKLACNLQEFTDYPESHAWVLNYGTLAISNTLFGVEGFDKEELSS